MPNTTEMKSMMKEYIKDQMEQYASLVPENVNALLNQLLLTPGDDGLRLIIADAMMEAEEQVSSYYVEEEQQPMKDAVVKWFGDYAQFIRVQIELDRLERTIVSDEHVKIINDKVVHVKNIVTEREQQHKKKLIELTAQQRTLLERIGVTRLQEAKHNNRIVHPTHDVMSYTQTSGVYIPAFFSRYERGFVSWIQCSTTWMIQNLDKEIKRNPITHVVINDQPAMNMFGRRSTPSNAPMGRYDSFADIVNTYDKRLDIHHQLTAFEKCDERDKLIISNLREVFPTIVNWTIL